MDRIDVPYQRLAEPPSADRAPMRHDAVKRIVPRDILAVLKRLAGGARYLSSAAEACEKFSRFDEFDAAKQSSDARHRRLVRDDDLMPYRG